MSEYNRERFTLSWVVLVVLPRSQLGKTGNGIEKKVRKKETNKWRKEGTLRSKLNLSMVGAVIACPLRDSQAIRGLTLDMCVFALYRCFARFRIRRV